MECQCSSSPAGGPEDRLCLTWWQSTRLWVPSSMSCLSAASSSPWRSSVPPATAPSSTTRVCSPGTEAPRPSTGKMAKTPPAAGIIILSFRGAFLWGPRAGVMQMPVLCRPMVPTHQLGKAPSVSKNGSGVGAGGDKGVAERSGFPSQLQSEQSVFSSCGSRRGDRVGRGACPKPHQETPWAPSR